MKRSGFLKLFLLLAGNLFLFYTIIAKEVVIHGNSPEYKGKTINLLVYKNQITDNERIISTTTVSNTGHFEWKLDIEQTTYVFAHVGVCHIFLYAEPGNIYEVELPPYVPKKIEDRLNPYFEETKIQILVKSATAQPQNVKIKKDEELNFLIHTFDDYYNPFFTKYAIKIYTKQQITELDSLTQKMEKLFGNNENPYFRAYYNYKMGLLKFTSSRFKSKHISDSYFLNQPVLYSNPAYMELFNQVYKKYFVFLGRTKAGAKIYDDINRYQSFTELRNTLRLDSVLSNETLLEFVILKSIHDGFYEMNFSRSALLTVLDSLIKTTKIKIHSEIGLDIREKVTKLLAGNAPPAIKLYDLNNKLTDLDEFKGNYVYLCFCITQNYACLKDFEQLKRIQEKFGKYLKIVCIAADDSLENARKYIQSKGYNWTFLHYGNKPDILKEYDIRIFPTYYLIDKEGKLLWSPAISPEENFEMRFFEELRARGIL
jgi:hypothetical protein